MKFLVFADLHYKKRMYAASVSHLTKIMERAAAVHAEFVVHLGDLCNDYAGSPELIRAYLENPQGLPVYGIYGNHELESARNSMERVTPLLSNRPVHFAAPDVAYWYADRGRYRLVGLDANYSLSPAGEWEHNRTASWGPPKENTLGSSLNPMQIAWLRDVLMDTANRGMEAIVLSHASVSGIWASTPDADAVRRIFAEVNAGHPGTVCLAINGHLHTDHFAVRDGVAYLDVNTVQNGFWSPRTEFHYAPEDTYDFLDYDDAGNPADAAVPVPLNQLTQGMNTWFFTEPLSAVITMEEDGTIRIEGSETAWMHGLVPETGNDAKKPRIESRVVKL